MAFSQDVGRYPSLCMDGDNWVKKWKHGNKSSDHVGASQTSEAKQEEGFRIVCQCVAGP